MAFLQQAEGLLIATGHATGVQPGRLSASADADRAQAVISALEAELEAAARAAADAAAAHQAEIDELQAALIDAKCASVTVQDSLSWRITAPLRKARPFIRRRGMRG